MSLHNASGKLPQHALFHAEDQLGSIERLKIMLLIFVVSLTAVSFPTITATFRSIRVPNIIFFIGKHFGTGVILSTAFVHLLQDAFKALQQPIVNDRWKVERWAGLMVLGSLLSIFLVEYVSTAFVDRLQAYPSAPSTPSESAVTSSASSLRNVPPDPQSSQVDQGQAPHDTEDAHPPGFPNPPQFLDTNEPRPLRPPSNSYHYLHSLNSETRPNYGATESGGHSLADRPSGNRHAPSTEEEIFQGGHHRHELRDSHASHHAGVPRWRWLGMAFTWYGRSADGVADGVMVHAHTHSHSGHVPKPVVLVAAEAAEPRKSVLSPQRECPQREQSHSRISPGLGEQHNGHEHHGHGHMDMEQWMSEVDGGVEGNEHRRVNSAGVDEEQAGGGEAAEVTKVGRRRQVIGILVLQLGIMIHSLVIGLTLSIAAGSEFTSLVIAIVFHQLFEGLSLGIRIAGLPSSHQEHGISHLPGNTLKPLLAITFATTTPLGIFIGLSTISGHSRGPKLVLMQGVMSAVSAGMLIYAACVEMLAGDFVMDAHLWRSSVGRQVLALGSLFAGVIAMAAIGLTVSSVVCRFLD